MKNIALILAIALLVVHPKSESKELSGESLFQIKSKWQTQDGKEVTLKDFEGQLTILSMAYLSCKFLCPTIISEVKSLESKIEPKHKEKIQVIIVSFDPEKWSPCSSAMSRTVSIVRSPSFRRAGQDGTPSSPPSASACGPPVPLAAGSFRHRVEERRRANDSPYIASRGRRDP